MNDNDLSDLRHTPLRTAIAVVMPIAALVAAPSLAVLSNLCMAALLDVCLFTAYGVRDLLRALDLTLLEIHLFPDDRGLLDVDLLLHERDSDLFAVIDLAGRLLSLSCGSTLYHDLFTGNRDLERPLLGHDFLPDTNFTRLHPLLLGPELLLAKLEGLRVLVGARSRADPSGVAAVSCPTPSHGPQIGATLGEAIASFVSAGSGIYSHQRTTGLEALIEVLGVLFGDTHPDQRAKESTSGRSDSSTSQRGSECAARDDRSDTRNGQSTDPSEKADYSAENPAPNRSCRGSFSCLGAGSFDEILLLLPILDGHSDLILGKASLFEVVDRSFGVCLVMKETDYRRTGSRVAGCSFAHDLKLLIAQKNLPVRTADGQRTGCKKIM
jgi:hypothetical protein